MNYSNLINLPEPPKSKKGWPWTQETPITSIFANDKNFWPKISIITPSYNQGQFIEETIRSVLLQNYPNIEYIIIDGGSTDGSIEVIRKYERWITYWVSEPDDGQTNAINKGFQKATGEIVAWLNSDDFYTPGALFSVAKAFLEKPNADVIYGNIKTVGVKTLKFPNICLNKYSRKRLFYSNYIPQPASFISINALRKVKFLDERFDYIMDYDLWMRLGKENVIFHYIPKTLAYFRFHRNSKTVSQQEKFWWERLEMFDNILRCESLEPDLAHIAYSRIFELLVYLSFSKMSLENLKSTKKINQHNHWRRSFLFQAIQEIKTSFFENNNTLQVFLQKFYRILRDEYNKGEDSNFPKFNSEWVNQQIVLLPIHLLNIKEKEKALTIYKKNINTNPCLLKYVETYKYLIKHFLT